MDFLSRENRSTPLTGRAHYGFHPDIPNCHRIGLVLRGDALAVNTGEKVPLTANQTSQCQRCARSDWDNAPRNHQLISIPNRTSFIARYVGKFCLFRNAAD